MSGRLRSHGPAPRVCLRDRESANTWRRMVGSTRRIHRVGPRISLCFLRTCSGGCNTRSRRSGRRGSSPRSRPQRRRRRKPRSCSDLTSALGESQGRRWHARGPPSRLQRLQRELRNVSVQAQLRTERGHRSEVPGCPPACDAAGPLLEVESEEGHRSGLLRQRASPSPPRNSRPISRSRSSSRSPSTRRTAYPRVSRCSGSPPAPWCTLLSQTKKYT